LPPEGRQGTRSFQDIVVDPKTGGYKLVSNIPGQEYNFGPSDYVKNMPKANPLYSDPGFLAWAANSGLSYDTAAASVARQKGALQNALAVKTPELQQQGEDKLKSIYGGYANRGLYGAGQQGVDEGKAQADTLSQIAGAQADTANQINGLTSGLVQKRQDLLADAANKGYGVAGQQDLTNRLNEVDRKYPGQAVPS
jgi:hypothetical protein